MRELTSNYFLNNLVEIGEPGLTVEIDESPFSQHENNVDSLNPEQWVLTELVGRQKVAFLVAVENRLAVQLIPIIKDFVCLGTTIISDEWKLYNQLFRHGYQHLAVTHNYTISGAHTQRIESN